MLYSEARTTLLSATLAKEESILTSFVGGMTPVEIIFPGPIPGDELFTPLSSIGETRAPRAHALPRLHNSRKPRLRHPRPSWSRCFRNSRLEGAT